MMTLKVIYFFSSISLAILIPGKRYLIETEDDQAYQAELEGSGVADPRCEGEDKDYEEIKIDKCNTCTCINGLLDDCTKEDCSLYTCEESDGPVMEGSLFHPKGDCNECVCENGKPVECTQYDCDKKHPGCMDKEGNMYKHGEWFGPKGDCNSCICENGTINTCTKRGCWKTY